MIGGAVVMKRTIMSMVLVGILASAVCLTMVGCGSQKVDEVSQKMIDDINALGEIQLADEDAINKLIDRYSTLTDAQKNSVTNYAALLDAQDKIELLKQEQVENQKQAEEDFLKQENVQICIDIIKDIKAGLKHPDTLELKQIYNRDYVASSGNKCTEFYIEYEAANDIGGVVNSTVFATVAMEGKNKGHVSLYAKDRGFLSEYYDSEATGWKDILANKADEVTEYDVSIIQNNL